jgi:hypothetical protein
MVLRGRQREEQSTRLACQVSAETRSLSRQSRESSQDETLGRLPRQTDHFGGRAVNCFGRWHNEPGEILGRNGESRKSEKAQGSIGRTIGGNTGSEQRILRWNKTLRSRQDRHFGDCGANDERGGALVTGRAATGEGKASKGGKRL